MSLQQIHPVLITRNAGATIERTLRSLRDFPEVVVYDNGSTDETLAVCARFSNVKVVVGEFMGFGPTKAHVVGLAGGDWVFSIDADEYPGESLLQSLRELDLTDERVAYSVERHNLFMGKDIRHAGWGNDWLIRLFNRRHCRFNDAVVHEKVTVPAGVGLVRLDGALWHQAATDIDQFLTKISRYSELEVKRGRPAHHPLTIVLHAGWAFFRSYVLRAGFLDGWRGLVIAYCFGVGCFFKHMKRYVDKTVPASERTRTPE
jgi:glycosyltransferase involved in cell wall biosynthesis